MPHLFSRRSVALAASTFALFTIACGGAEAALPTIGPEASATTQSSPLSTISENEAMIWLEAPNGNFQTGWAHIWEENNSLFVDIEVAPASAVAQPAHIHRGQCTLLGVIDHRLDNVIGGKSFSELPGVKLTDIAIGTLAINLHASFADFSTFTACGEIPALSGSIEPSPSDPVVPEQPVAPELSESGYGF